MPPRTRATASASSAVAPLAAAPRRRVKVTPLEKESTKHTTPATEDTKSTTRTTRRKKVENETVEEPKATKSKATATASAAPTTRGRGRPRKTENAATDAGSAPTKPTEPLSEKPKRATRSTRATATTRSSEAKEKPAVRASRSTRNATKEEAESEPIPEQEATAEEAVPATKTGPKKKVTFQEVIEDEKENQPITRRGTKMSTSAKATKTSAKTTGLRAKPVRKPAAATRGSKRVKDQLSDDEDEPPKKKIQRVLTPKKITQVAKAAAATPEDMSEDELNGGKTPVRDLSMSPRRPQLNLTVEAMARSISPAKKFEFNPSLLQQSAKKSAAIDSTAPLLSPARRPADSPAKIFSQSRSQSPVRLLGEASATAIASPARRPFASPAKLLFPNTTKGDHRVNLAQSSNHLFQSPKRSAAFDSGHMFPHSSTKPQKHRLSRSNFFSSPAKRAGFFSPVKQSTTPQRDASAAPTEDCVSSDELDLNEMQVTQLLAEPAEISVTSHQRTSVSPMRTYKLTADELQMDFDQSILPVGSPPKLAQSPIRLAPQPLSSPDPETATASSQLGEEASEGLSSVQSTPHGPSHNGSTFVSLRALEGEHSSYDLQQDETADSAEPVDDTIVLAETNEAEATPRPAIASYQVNDDSIDELAHSPQEDVIAKFVRTPGTPASLLEHELTRMVSAPGTAVVSSRVPEGEQPEAEVSSPASLCENEMTIMGGTPKARITPECAPVKSAASPASLFESELTIMGGTPKPRTTPKRAPVKAAASPASLYENELTMIGGTPRAQITPDHTIVEAEASPASLYENELTMMGARSEILHAAASPASVYEHELTQLAAEQRRKPSESPVSIAEHELTIMGGTPKATITPKSARREPLDSPSSPRRNELTLVGKSSTPLPPQASLSKYEPLATATPRTAMTPASIAEHELTVMGETSPGKELPVDDEATPVPPAVYHPTFTPPMPIPRKYNLHTVVSKVPLKPEGQESPFKLQIKKRKRPLSLGGQPGGIDIGDELTPVRATRVKLSPDASSGRADQVTTPAAQTVQHTPASKLAGTKSARRAASTPVSRTPLAAVNASSVLTGVIAYVDVRTSEGADASAIYIDLLSNLGARVVKEWKDNMTHIIFKDGNHKVLERACLADTDIKVVGVSWPLDCEAQHTWVDETEYLLNLTPTDHILNSVAKSARRKSMEPSMLIADGSGSVKRTRSRGRASIASRRGSFKLPFDTTPRTSPDPGVEESDGNLVTPPQDTAKKQVDLERNSLTAAWKSINASHNLGEDTPARRTLELLQKSYDMENEWDDSLVSDSTIEDNDQENTPQSHGASPVNQTDEDTEILETGLTPAPYRVALQIGSAPAKANNNGFMTYRERVEEMERREMRDNAFGTNKGARGKNAKRMTVFGAGLGFEPIRKSPLRD